MGLLSSLFGKKDAQPGADPQQHPDVDLDPGEALGSADGALRVDAARALIERWRSGDTDAAAVLAPRLPELLGDPEPLVRVVALSGVRLLRNPDNLAKCEQGVLALLADRVPQVRTAAIWSAIRIPGDAARSQVRAVLRSGEESMRFAAACAMSDVQDPAGLPELQAALRDDHRRQEALSAMMSLGDPAAVPAVAALFEEEPLGDFDRTLAAAALARLGDGRGGAHLISRLESDGDDRPLAAEWAGRLGVHDAIPILTELAQAEGDPARGAAIRALGRLKAAGAEERLQAVAGDPDAPEDLRMDAAEGLAELGTPAALDLLRKLAGDGPPELKQLCEELLVEVQAGAD